MGWGWHRPEIDPRPPRNGAGEFGLSTPDPYAGSKDEEEHRRAGLQQLMEITLELQRSGIPGETLRPTTAIIHGLMDLEKGISFGDLSEKTEGRGAAGRWNAARQLALLGG